MKACRANALGAIPTSALKYAEEDVTRAELLGQLDNSFVPVTAQYLIMQTNAGNMNSLAVSNYRRLGRDYAKQGAPGQKHLCCAL
ncbi:hypothetical protein N7451_012558 [Penicillium sp. IBT 35674x]|nr:hypothetical protein N7451_012558 [Penicillium sp. IBT 35674x]